MPYCHIPMFLNSEASLRWSGGILQEDRNYGKFWTKVIALALLRHCALQIFVSKSGADFIQTTTMGPGGPPALLSAVVTIVHFWRRSCVHKVTIATQLAHTLYIYCTHFALTLSTHCAHIYPVSPHIEQLTILQFQCTAKMRRQMVAFTLRAVSQICKKVQTYSAKCKRTQQMQCKSSVDPEKMCSMQLRGEADGFWGS